MVVRLLVLWLAGCVASHDGPVGLRAEGGLGVYTNDDGLTVVGPWVDSQQPVSETITVGVGWQADVISAASIDVVSSATQPFAETRHQGSVRVGADLDATRFNTSAIVSSERDTLTALVSGSAERDLAEHTLTLGLAYSAGFYKIGTVHEALERWRDKQVHQVEATATRVFDKNTVASASYTFQYQGGALANPYLKVPLFPADESLWDRHHAAFVGERLPSTRLRHSVNVSGRRALSDNLFLWGGWQGYLDTWSVRANTGDVGLGLSLRSGLSFELTERLRWQSRASFYRSAYTVNRTYLTRDRRLGELFTESGGVAVRLRRYPVEAMIGAEVQWTHFADLRVLDGDALAPFPDTLALLTQAGFVAEF